MANADTVKEVERFLEQLQRLQANVAAIEAEWHRRRLAAAPVLPGQKGDGRLYEPIDRFTKGVETMSTVFATIVDGEPRPGGTIIEALGRVGVGLVSGLRKALGAAVDSAIRQMGNLALRPAGKLVSAEVSPAGMVRIRAFVDDATAALKIAEKVYPLLRISMAGDAIERIDFVDSLSLEKRGDRAVLCKVFSREEIAMADVPEYRRHFASLPESSQRAIVEIEQASEMVKAMSGHTNGDRMAAQLRLDRAIAAGNLEIVKRNQSQAARIVPWWAGG